MKTILIIEDNQDIRENTVELLELNQYIVLAAENGREGLAMAKMHLPDVIVCDLMMPEMDGYQVLEDLKSDAATTAIPFIFLTASVERQAVEKGLDMGACAYLRKPFETEDLFKTITSALTEK